MKLETLRKDLYKLIDLQKELYLMTRDIIDYNKKTAEICGNLRGYKSCMMSEAYFKKFKKVNKIYWSFLENVIETIEKNND